MWERPSAMSGGLGAGGGASGAPAAGARGWCGGERADPAVGRESAPFHEATTSSRVEPSFATGWAALTGIPRRGDACDRGDARRSALLLSGPLLAIVAALNFGMA